MLTVDLVRARIGKGEIRPRFVLTTSDALNAQVEGLVALFAEHVNAQVGVLKEAIDEHIGHSPDYAVQRGLTKLLMDGSTVASNCHFDPYEARRALFLKSAAHWPPVADVRTELMNEVSRSLKVSAQALEAGMYGDLKDQEVLLEVELPQPTALLEKYNLSLAQAVLLRAREVVITLPALPVKKLRWLFRLLKFRRLLHRVQCQTEGYVITIDGPLSLFRQTTRYGLQMALFFPALCLLEQWKLKADVVWGRERESLILSLDEKIGLRSTVKETGTWEGAEERAFRAGWSKMKGPWKLRKNTAVIDLHGERVLIPDYRMVHEDGRVALLDIVWTWSRPRFAQYMDLVRAHGPRNLVVALATRLQGDDGEGQLDDLRIVPFKGVIQPKKVCAAAERVAIKVSG